MEAAGWHSQAETDPPGWNLAPYQSSAQSTFYIIHIPYEGGFLYFPLIASPSKEAPFKMRPTIAPRIVLTLILLFTTSGVDARRGLNPDELHLLTRGTDYTFHSICADFKNPDLFFDEWVHALISLTALFPILLEIIHMALDTNIV